MGLKILEGDLDAARGRCRGMLIFLIDRVMCLRLLALFDAIKVSRGLSQRGGGDGQDALHIPPGPRHKANHGPCSDDITIGQANERLVAAQSPAQEDPVPEPLVCFGSKALGHKPENPFSELAEPLASLVAMKAPQSSTTIFAKLVLI